jgi:hypothetical protein
MHITAIVICGQGKASKYTTDGLTSLGFRVQG